MCTPSKVTVNTLTLSCAHARALSLFTWKSCIYINTITLSQTHNHSPAVVMWCCPLPPFKQQYNEKDDEMSEREMRELLRFYGSMSTEECKEKAVELFELLDISQTGTSALAPHGLLYG